MRALAKKAIEIIQGRGGKIIDLELIERTLWEIGKQYRPGLIRWIRENRPHEWRRMAAIGEKIDMAALSDDEGALRDALSEYRAFFSRMGEGFVNPQGSLF